MDNIEWIHEILDELANVVKEEFPDYTNVSTMCDADGYRTFTVAKWGNGEVTEVIPRRELFEQSRIGGEWNKDRSQTQNDYYDSLGILLKD